MGVMLILLVFSLVEDLGLKSLIFFIISGFGLNLLKIIFLLSLLRELTWPFVMRLKTIGLS